MKKRNPSAIFMKSYPSSKTYISDIENYDNHIIIYDDSNLNDQPQDIIRIHNYAPSKMQLRYKNFSCIRIHYRNNGKNVFYVLIQTTNITFHIRI